MYSRLQLGLNAAKAAAAGLLFLSAAAKASGVSAAGLGVLTTRRWAVDAVLALAAVDQVDGAAEVGEHLLVGRHVLECL